MRPCVEGNALLASGVPERLGDHYYPLWGSIDTLRCLRKSSGGVRKGGPRTAGEGGEAANLFNVTL